MAIHLLKHIFNQFLLRISYEIFGNCLFDRFFLNCLSFLNQKVVPLFFWDKSMVCSRIRKVNPWKLVIMLFNFFLNALGCRCRYEKACLSSIINWSCIKSCFYWSIFFKIIIVICLILQLFHLFFKGCFSLFFFNFIILQVLL